MSRGKTGARAKPAWPLRLGQRVGGHVVRVWQRCAGAEGGRVRNVWFPCGSVEMGKKGLGQGEMRRTRSREGWTPSSFSAQRRTPCHRLPSRATAVAAACDQTRHGGQRRTAAGVCCMLGCTCVNMDVCVSTCVCVCIHGGLAGVDLGLALPQALNTIHHHRRLRRRGLECTGPWHPVCDRPAWNCNYAWLRRLRDDAGRAKLQKVTYATRETKMPTGSGCRGGTC